MEKSLKRKPREIADLPELPQDAAYLWSTFVELKNASDGPISYSEMDAYIRLTGETLTPDEIRVIRRLDELHQKEKTKP